MQQKCIEFATNSAQFGTIYSSLAYTSSSADWKRPKNKYIEQSSYGACTSLLINRARTFYYSFAYCICLELSQLLRLLTESKALQTNESFILWVVQSISEADGIAKIINFSAIFPYIRWHAVMPTIKLNEPDVRYSLPCA